MIVDTGHEHGPPPWPRGLLMAPSHAQDTVNLVKVQLARLHHGNQFGAFGHGIPKEDHLMSFLTASPKIANK